MPSFIPKNEKVNSTADANYSRLVTKVRWVVEAYHARIKQWRYLANRQPNYHIAREEKIVKILSAACNAYKPPLCQDKPGDRKMAERMLEKAKETQNHVFDKVKKGTLSSRGKWIDLNITSDEQWCNLTDTEVLKRFPKWTQQQLVQFTFGVYQIKQAKSYTNEHMNDAGDYNVQFHNQTDELVRVRLQSRHKNSTKYFLWIEHNGETVTGHYCQCKAGKRTVGCCAHVAAVLWYLTFARHNGYQPSKHKWWNLLDAAGVEEEEEEG
eukprot:Lithocolla_globosa_v1_NODE_3946_length_1545_cov_8.134228.p1 type:complete len:267 gc:universal NODE_3946_length_1545_cov_8.134228:592-1392(+)